VGPAVVCHSAAPCGRDLIGPLPERRNKTDPKKFQKNSKSELVFYRRTDYTWLKCVTFGYGFRSSA
jgi:hypothetical protein